MADRYSPAAYTAAKTDEVIVSTPSGFMFVLTAYEVMLSKDAPVASLSFNFEFDDTADVEIASHPGLAPGSGVICRGSPTEPIAMGADGQDLLFNCGDPTAGLGGAGKIKVSVNGYFLPVS